MCDTMSDEHDEQEEQEFDVEKIVGKRYTRNNQVIEKRSM